MNEITNKIYNHIRSVARLNSFNGQIILPTARQTSEALEIDIEQVEDSYQDLLEYGSIEEYSQYQVVPGLQFNYPQKLKDRMRLGY